MRHLMSALAAGVIGLAAVGAQAGDLVRVASPHSVPETVDRLVAAVEGAGARVFAQIDHAAGAESVDMELAPATTVLFGNPKLGTPAMQASLTMALDLPLRVLVMDQDGQTVMVYHAPADVGAEHGLPVDHPVLARMTGALANLTAKAAGE